MKTKLLIAVLTVSFCTSFGQKIDHRGFKDPFVSKATKHIALDAGSKVNLCQFGNFGDGLLYIKAGGSPNAQFLDSVGSVVFAIAGSPAHPFQKPCFNSGVCPILGVDGAMLIDKTGRTIASLTPYYNINNYVDGYTTAMMGSGDNAINVYIDTLGRRIYEHLSFRALGQPAPPYRFVDGLAPFYNGSTGLWGFFNKQGQVVVKAAFLKIRGFSDGLSAVKSVDGKWGYVDSTGDYRLKTWLTVEPQDFWQGKAIISKSKGQVCYIDKSGGVLSRDFDAATPFYNGYAAVKDGKNTYIINEKFVPLRQLYLNPSPVEASRYRFFEKQRVGIIGNTTIVSSSFNILVYSDFIEYVGGSLAFCRHDTPKGQSVGYINLAGEFVFVFE